MNLADIRNDLSIYRGKQVQLRILGERNRVSSAFGVLDGLYPEIFTVLVCEGERSFHCSFSYRDILMGKLDVRLQGPALEYA